MRALHLGPLLFGNWWGRRRGRLKLAHWNMLERLMLGAIVLLVVAILLGLTF
jgi:uncharacterized membrane protein SpoIIM required for sporulation